MKGPPVLRNHARHEVARRENVSVEPFHLFRYLDEQAFLVGEPSNGPLLDARGDCRAVSSLVAPRCAALPDEDDVVDRRGVWIFEARTSMLRVWIAPSTCSPRSGSGYTAPRRSGTSS